MVLLCWKRGGEDGGGFGLWTPRLGLLLRRHHRLHFHRLSSAEAALLPAPGVSQHRCSQTPMLGHSLSVAARLEPPRTAAKERYASLARWNLGGLLRKSGARIPAGPFRCNSARQRWPGHFGVHGGGGGGGVEVTGMERSSAGLIGCRMCEELSLTCAGRLRFRPSLFQRGSSSSIRGRELYIGSGRAVESLTDSRTAAACRLSLPRFSSPVSLPPVRQPSASNLGELLMPLPLPSCDASRGCAACPCGF